MLKLAYVCDSLKQAKVLVTRLLRRGNGVHEADRGASRVYFRLGLTTIPSQRGALGLTSYSNTNLED